MNSTDVLKAQCIPVGDRVYRLLSIRNSVTNVEDYEVITKKIPGDTLSDDEEDLVPDLIISHQGNTFYATFHVPPSLLKCVTGYQFKIKKALEQLYGAKINVPQKDSTTTGITVSGPTKKIVSLTCSSIKSRVTDARLRKESRHFISLPINSDNIQGSFLKFKEEVLSKYKRVRGIDESIFQNPKKLHLTVALLVLLDSRDNQEAIAIVKECRDDYLKEFGAKELVVHVKGIEYMNDDPSEVDVLYAKLQEPDGDNSLQIIADKIMNKFVDSKLARKQHDRVKLHVTLMNTIFRKHLETKDDKDFERVTFDARPILEDYIDYDFGQTVISEIHISIRYTAGSDGYYNYIDKLNINS